MQPTLNLSLVDNIGCFNIKMIHVTAHNTSYNNVSFLFASDLKTVFSSNYKSSITMSWTRKDKYFASLLIW